MYNVDKTGVDQTIVKEKINCFLRIYKEERFIRDFNGCYCFGVSFLWLYFKWLLNQPTSKDKPKYDYEWFKSTEKLIFNWDGESELNREEFQEIEKYVSLIQYFQHIDNCLPINQKPLGQGLEYIESIEKKLKKEYAIASLLTLEQLKQLLKVENMVQDGKLILIESYDSHVTALFKEKEKYCYFDPKSEVDEFQTTSIDEIAKLIFDANFNSFYTKPSPLGLRIFSFDENYAKYPIQKNILDSINPTLNPEKNYANEVSGLISAASVGSLESVQYFLERGINPNIKNQNDSTALVLAAYHGYLEITKELIANKATNPNVRNKDDVTALILAAGYGHTEVTKALLTDMRSLQNKNVWMALMWAIRNNHLEVVKELLSVEVDFNSISNWIRDCDDRTVLMLAVEHGCIDIVRELLTIKNINPNLQNRNEETTLMLAAEHGHVDIVKMLLKNQNININMQNSDGNTALTLAIYDKHVDIVEMLLANRANVNIQNKDGWTALMKAAMHGNVDIVQALFLVNNIDPNIPDKRGCTAFMLAAKNGHIEVVRKFLTNEHVDFNLVDKYGRTAFMLAAENGYVDVIKELLPVNSVDTSKVDSSGENAFMLAAKRGRVDVVKELLVSSNIDPNICDRYGQTALMLAAEGYCDGCIGVVRELLLVNNIDINKTDRYGKNAFELNRCRDNCHKLLRYH